MQWDLTDLSEEEFLGLWNGRDDIGGVSVAWRMAAQWLAQQDEEIIPYITHACVIFLDKPADYVVTGVRKNDMTPGVTLLDERLYQLVPQLTSGYSGPKRRNWGVWKDMNLSMAQRVGMIALEKNWVHIPIVRRWIQKYGGRPSRIDQNSTGFRKLSVNSETLRIFQSMLRDMESSRDTWWTEV